MAEYHYNSYNVLHKFQSHFWFVFTKFCILKETFWTFEIEVMTFYPTKHVWPLDSRHIYMYEDQSILTTLYLLNRFNVHDINVTLISFTDSLYTVMRNLNPQISNNWTLFPKVKSIHNWKTQMVISQHKRFI